MAGNDARHAVVDHIQATNFVFAYVSGYNTLLCELARHIRQTLGSHVAGNTLPYCARSSIHD